MCNSETYDCCICTEHVQTFQQPSDSCLRGIRLIFPSRPNSLHKQIKYDFIFPSIISVVALHNFRAEWNWMLQKKELLYLENKLKMCLPSISHQQLLFHQIISDNFSIHLSIKRADYGMCKSAFAIHLPPTTQQVVRGLSAPVQGSVLLPLSTLLFLPLSSLVQLTLEILPH